MNRVIITAPEGKTFEAITDSTKRGEHAISAESPFIPKATILEWMYAAQALIIYGNKKSSLIDHAIKLGIPVEYRRLDGTAENNKDSE